MEDDVDAGLILTERELLAFARILERFGSNSGVLGDDCAVGTNLSHACPVTRLEFVDERDIHSADESNFFGVADKSGQSADKERAFFFAELESGEVSWWRNDVAFVIHRKGIVHACE